MVASERKLRERARKKAKAGCYAMPPKEAFDGLMDYYGLAHSDADYGASNSCYKKIGFEQVGSLCTVQGKDRENHGA